MQTERELVREALSNSAATEDIARRMGDELIAASREVVRAYRELKSAEERMVSAVAALEKLVGGPA
jgi:chaperonin cofactor prefoldin